MLKTVPRRLRIGVAGLGRAFSVMLPTFTRDPRVELVAGADPRAEALVTSFAQQWLHIRNVREIAPDPVLFPGYTPNLGDACMRQVPA